MKFFAFNIKNSSCSWVQNIPYAPLNEFSLFIFIHSHLSCCVNGNDEWRWLRVFFSFICLHPRHEAHICRILNAICYFYNPYMLCVISLACAASILCKYFSLIERTFVWIWIKKCWRWKFNEFILFKKMFN